MGDQIVTQLIYYLTALWRRRWLAVAVATVVAVGGWSIVATMPDRYEASARVYVDTSTVLRPLLRGMTVDSNTRQQLEVMRQSLMTRPNLERVARMTDLDLRVNTDAEMSGLVERLRANTRISMNRSNIFQVSYNGSDPRKSKAVVDSLTTIFVEQNIGRDRADFQKAESFLQNQIQETSARLQEVESRINTARQKVARLVPGTEDDYGSKVTQLSNRIDSLRERLEAARTRRDTLAQELANTPKQLPGGEAGASQLQRSIAQVEDKLAELRLRYTEQHPDVLTAKRRLEQLRTQQAEGGNEPASGSGRGSGATNPVYNQLQVSLVEERSEISILEKQLSESRNTLQTLRSRQDEIREIEGQLSELRNQRELYGSRLSELRQRLQSAELSSERQAEGDSVTFRMIEPPVVPQQPSGPNRALLATGVLVVAFGAGAAAAWFFALLKSSYGSVQRLKKDFPIPVIGHISVVRSRRDVILARLDRVAFAGATASLVAVYGGLMFIERQMGLSVFVSERVGLGSGVNLLETLRGLL